MRWSLGLCSAIGDWTTGASSSRSLPGSAWLGSPSMAQPFTRSCRDSAWIPHREGGRRQHDICRQFHRPPLAAVHAVVACVIGRTGDLRGLREQDCSNCRCWPGGPDGGTRAAAPDGLPAARLRGGHTGRRHLEDGQLPRQPHGPRRPPVLLEVRLGHELVAGHPAGGGRRRGPATAVTSPTRASSANSRGRCRAGATTDRVMLVRPRLSRIYYRRRFFDYPLKLNADTIGNLGLDRGGAARRELREVARCCRATRRRRSRTSSSIASATACTGRSSRTTRRRSGACPARDLRRVGCAAGQGTVDHERADARRSARHPQPGRTSHRRTSRRA